MPHGHGSHGHGSQGHHASHHASTHSYHHSSGHASHVTPHTSTHTYSHVPRRMPLHIPYIFHRTHTDSVTTSTRVPIGLPFEVKPQSYWLVGVVIGAILLVAYLFATLDE